MVIKYRARALGKFQVSIINYFERQIVYCHFQLSFYAIFREMWLQNLTKWKPCKLKPIRNVLLYVFYLCVSASSLQIVKNDFHFVIY